MSDTTLHEEGLRTYLNPSRDGSADRLTRIVGRGHEVIATAMALIFSFAVIGVAMIALGLLVTHVFVHGSIGAWDHHVSVWFDQHRSTHWNRITGDVTNVADTFEIAGVAAVLTIVLLFRRWGRHAFLLIAGLAIELSVFLTVNAIVARPRPSVRHLGGTPSTFSFPSGHTAATFMLYGGVAVIVAVATTRWWARVMMWTFAVALTVAVALSRVYRGEHFPTDVIAGFLLGAGSLVAAVFIIRVTGVNRTEASNASERWILVTEATPTNDAAQ